MAIRGVVAILFGILTFTVPALTLIYLVMLFGFYALLDGVFNIVSGFREPAQRWPFLVKGAIGIFEIAADVRLRRILSSRDPKSLTQIIVFTTYSDLRYPSVY